MFVRNADELPVCCITKVWRRRACFFLPVIKLNFSNLSFIISVSFKGKLFSLIIGGRNYLSKFISNSQNITGRRFIAKVMEPEWIFVQIYQPDSRPGVVLNNEVVLIIKIKLTGRSHGKINICIRFLPLDKSAIGVLR